LESVVASSARYWMYCEVAPIAAGELESVVKPVHVSSGVALLPVRTWNTRLVPGGVSLVHEAVVHVAGPPASKTLESKVHGVA
jgi:hypothetical protein